MYRQIACVGPPARVGDLLVAPDHGLLRQSWAPRHQPHGTVNADGFGVGWYAAEDLASTPGQGRAREELTAKIPSLGLAVHFAAGEYIRTEISAKFRQEGIRAELAAAGLELRHWWTDRAGRFAVSLAVRS